MTQTSWPFDGVATTEPQFGQWARRLQQDGVWGDDTTADLKPYGSSSGMNVKFDAGYAFARGVMYHTDATVTVTVTAASGNPRIDTLVLRLSEDDNAILPVVIAGTPTAGTPVPNPPVQTESGNYDILLGYIDVPAGASTIAAGNVHDARSFAGVQWGHWWTATRPANPRRGDAGFNYSTNAAEIWNGSVWKDLLPSVITADVIGDLTGNVEGDVEGNLVGRVNDIRITVSQTPPSSPVPLHELWVSW